MKKLLSELPITLFCLHNNHENRPQNITSYAEEEWHGGIIFVEEKYPNLLFAKDEEIFDLDGNKYIIIGGAYSVDKSAEEWLDKIEEQTHYKKWYCGHYHTEKRIDRLQFMFESIDEFRI